MVAVVVEEQREREGSGRVASGYSLLFDAKQIGQGEKGFSRSLDSRERSPADPVLSLWLA
jgi:hypothetical protein